MRTPHRLFTMRPEGDSRGLSTFYPGVIADGSQILIVRAKGTFCCCWFNSHGVLLKSERRACAGRSQKESFEDVNRRLRAVCNGWQDELGLEPAPIRVRQFVLPDPPFYNIGVAVYPRWQIDLMEKPYNRSDPQERTETFQVMTKWLSEEAYVFHNGHTEYFIHNDGREVSN